VIINVLNVQEPSPIVPNVGVIDFSILQELVNAQNSCTLIQHKQIAYPVTIPVVCVIGTNSQESLRIPDVQPVEETNSWRKILAPLVNISQPVSVTSPRQSQARQIPAQSTANHVRF
jgi:hypothetical protein